MNVSEFINNGNRFYLNWNLEVEKYPIFDYTYDSYDNLESVDVVKDTKNYMFHVVKAYYTELPNPTIFEVKLIADYGDILLKSNGLGEVQIVSQTVAKNLL